MAKKIFPGEQEEIPVNPQRPEIVKPAEPIGPNTPQEQPQQEPSEVPPSPVTPSPSPDPIAPQGIFSPNM